jgi:hypothetical protein
VPSKEADEVTVENGWRRGPGPRESRFRGSRGTVYMKTGLAAKRVIAFGKKSR